RVGRIATHVPLKPGLRAPPTSLPPPPALSRASSRHSGQRGDCQRAASLISEQGSAHLAGATCGPGSSRLLFPTQGPVGLTVGTTVRTRCHAAASTDGHLSHAADRLASARVRRAAVARDIRSAGAASPVPKYISSGVCPRNAECRSTWLYSWT